MALASYRSFRSFRAASANAEQWEDVDLRPADEAEVEREARVRRAVFRKLLPPLFVLSLVCYLDRTNISYAALQMNRDLGFTPQVYAIGTAIFFIGYTAFEVPSNMVLHRVGAPRWLARIAVTCASGGGGRHPPPGDAGGLTRAHAVVKRGHRGRAHGPRQRARVLLPHAVPLGGR